MEQGSRLHTHEDIPNEIRKQLYAEEQQNGERQRKRKATSQASYPPINITNVLPHQALASKELIPVSTRRTSSNPPIPLKIPEPLDVAIKRYSN